MSDIIGAYFLGMAASLILVVPLVAVRWIKSVANAAMT